MITRVRPTHNFHAFDVWTCLQTEGVAALSLDIGDHFPDLETGHHVGRGWVTIGGLEVILGVYKELVKQSWLKKKLRRLIEEGIKTNAGWRTDDNWKMNNLNRKGRKKGTDWKYRGWNIKFVASRKDLASKPEGGSNIYWIVMFLQETRGCPWQRWSRFI